MTLVGLDKAALENGRMWEDPIDGFLSQRLADIKHARYLGDICGQMYGDSQDPGKQNKSMMSGRSASSGCVWDVSELCVHRELIFYLLKKT